MKTGSNWSVDRFRLGRAWTPVVHPGGGPGRPQQGKQARSFLKGPIPWAWLTAAASLTSETGAAFKVGILLWFQAGLRKRLTRLTVSTPALQDFGLDRFAYYRALDKLEEAGLIRVDRGRGRGKMLAVSVVTAPKEA